MLNPNLASKFHTKEFERILNNFQNGAVNRRGVLNCWIKLFKTFLHLPNRNSMIFFFFSSLDLSFNKIRKITNLETLVNVTNLFLVNNKISKIENISMLTNLVMLELGSNRIRVSMVDLKLTFCLSSYKQSRSSDFLDMFLGLRSPDAGTF